MKRLRAAVAQLHRKWVLGFLVQMVLLSAASMLLFVACLVTLAIVLVAGLDEKIFIYMVLLSAIVWLPLSSGLAYDRLLGLDVEAEEIIRPNPESD